MVKNRSLDASIVALESSIINSSIEFTISITSSLESSIIIYLS